jgi:hypothetical protein
LHRIGPSPCLQYQPTQLKRPEPTGRTAAPCSHRPRAACPNHGTTSAVDSPAAVSLPPDSPLRRLRPPPIPAIKGAQPPREQPFFLRPVTPAALPCSATIEPPCSAALSPPPGSPSPPRAPHRRVRPSRTVSRRPSPPNAAPTTIPLRLTAHRCRARLSSEDLPLFDTQSGVPCCRAALAPLLYRPRHRQAGAGWATASATVGCAHCSCSAVMGHQPKEVGPAEAGRLNTTHLHSATYHFHSIKH